MGNCDHCDTELIKYGKRFRCPYCGFIEENQIREEAEDVQTNS